MLLTDKQVEQFIEWYREFYWDTSAETWTWKLPKICKEHEELHKQLWKDKIDKLLWKNKNKKYTHKWWREEEYRDVVFNWLWLQFWPTVVDEPYKQTGVEVWWWYDWIAFYTDQFWNRYSRWWIPIKRDELCRYSYIYKVKEKWEYDYEVIEKREDAK